ncbi:MAG TPA: nitronate monooxygenase [Rhizomicrobium sp.]
MNPKLHTPVCDLLGCELPIVLAGMGGPSRSELVAAVTNAGGFGFLGMVREPPELILSEVEKVRAATDRDFGVNLIPAATKPDLLEAEIAAVLAARVPVVCLFWDLSAGIVKRLRGEGVLVVCQVGSIGEAEDAQKAGAQILIAQGVEAGGHVRGTTPRADIVRGVVKNADVPVLAAGGMSSGRDLVEMLNLGAQGIVLGTALLATKESFAHDYHKQRLVAAKPGETVHTQDFHVNWPKGAHVRVLENSVTRREHGDPFSGHREAIGKEGGRTIWLFSTDSPLKDMTGDFEKMALYAGNASGAIRDVVSAADRIAAIIAEADALLPKAATAALEVEEKLSSPVCYANESSNQYAGYATREELIAFCNELLEAERAGARITARSATEARDAETRDLLRDIQKDEARWCAMLLKWIAQLDGAASPRVGAFYEKCLAIQDLKERIAFINRGQGWVVKKLREMLPKVRDDALHADFTAMLVSHEENIRRAS